MKTLKPPPKPEKKPQKEEENDDDDDDDEEVKKEPLEKKEEPVEAASEVPSEVTPTKPSRSSKPDGRLRVLAYSDSDSDVEPHFQILKEQLLPGLDAETKAAEEAAEAAEVLAEEERRQNQLRASTSGRALTQIAAGVTGLVEYVGRQMTPSILIKTAALVILRGANSPVADAANAAALVTGAAGLFAERRSRRRGGASPSVERLQSHAIDFGKAAAVAVLVKVIQQARKQRRGKSRSQRYINRLVSGVNLSLLEESFVAEDPATPPQTAADWAAVYFTEINEMKRMLEECGIELLPPRWDETNAELMRFATACGLQKAETAAARGGAIEKAVQRVIATVEWSSQQPPMGETKLKRWERLVVWRGSDSGGHPILLVRFGRALQLCHKSGRLETFTDAILAQVVEGIKERLHNGPGGPERIVAIIDFRETSNWKAFLGTRQISNLAKRLAGDLAAHFPERLQQIHLLELPIMAKMGLQSVLTTLPQEIRNKIVPASVDDGSLPVTVALLQRRRSCARGLGRAMSDVSLATTEDNMTPRGELLAEEEEVEEEILNEAAAVLAGMGGDGIPIDVSGLLQRSSTQDEGGSSVYASPREELSLGTSIDFELLSAREASEYGIVPGGQFNVPIESVALRDLGSILICPHL